MHQIDKELSKFKAVEEPYGETWYELTYKQLKKEKNAKKVTSPIKSDEIYRICFQEIKEEVKKRLGEVLEVIKERPSLKFFEDGLCKLKRSMHLSCNPLCDGLRDGFAKQAMGEEIVARLLAEDTTVKALVVESVCA